MRRDRNILFLPFLFLYKVAPKFNAFRIINIIILTGECYVLKQDTTFYSISRRGLLNYDNISLL